VSTERLVRLCLKDLYQQDIIEMVERETRRYELVSIEDTAHPDLSRAYRLLWDAFGPQGEMEPEDAIRGFVAADRYGPHSGGTFIRYFLIVARDREGNLRGVRDGSVLYNPAYAPGSCLVYLSHIFVLPEARGTVLTYWLRIAPVELAVEYLLALHQRGLISLPAPDAPGKYFGLQMSLCAEMEYFSPDDQLSLQRILFYGRSGFDAIDPRHFPYRQPDFRDAETIRATTDTPIPFMLLLRRMGRERQARIPLDEAAAIMRLLYDEFGCFSSSERIRSSLEIVLQRLDERRRKGKTDVALLPLPTGAKDLHRLKRLFRYDIYQRSYAGAPGTEAYLASIGQRLRENPRWFDEELARIRNVLETSTRSVYGSRDRRFLIDAMPALLAEAEEDTQRADAPLQASGGFETRSAANTTAASAGGRTKPSGDPD
jgi:hypothetical protein